MSNEIINNLVIKKFQHRKYKKAALIMNRKLLNPVHKLQVHRPNFHVSIILPQTAWRWKRYSPITYKNLPVIR